MSEESFCVSRATDPIHCDYDLSAAHSSASHEASGSAIRLVTHTGVAWVGKGNRQNLQIFLPETASRAGVAATGETDTHTSRLVIA